MQNHIITLFILLKNTVYNLSRSDFGDSKNWKWERTYYKITVDPKKAFLVQSKV